VQISEIDIISVDQSDDFWDIEGEILFESDLSIGFSVSYLPDEDELENLEFEVNPGKYDKHLLKEMILEAVNGYND
jgi:hypothetical protein